MTNPLLDTFLAEAAELLADVDGGLLELERNPTDPELINQVFRAAHTIKGSAGLFELAELIQVTHAAEDLLDAARAGERTLDPALVDSLLAAFDLVRRFLGHVTATGELPADAAGDAAPVIGRLRGGGAGPAAVGSVAGPAAAAPLSRAPRWAAVLGEEWLRELAEWLTLTDSSIRLVHYAPASDCYFRGEDPLRTVAQVAALERLVLDAPGVPDLAAFDEYNCDLTLTLASRAGIGELRYIFRYVPDEVEVLEVSGPGLLAALDPDQEPAAPAESAAPVEAAPADDGHADAWFLLEQSLAALEVGGKPAHLVSVARSGAAAAAVLGLDPTDLGVAADAGKVAAARDALRGLLAGRTAAPAAPAAVERRPDAAPAPDTPDQAADQPRVGSKVLKVDQERIDYLVDLVGELIVAKNALPFLAAHAEDVSGDRLLGRQIKDQYGVLHRIAEDLRGGVMAMRMLPFSMAFARFPRLVRDLGRRLDKQVELVTDGEDTAADKDIIEALGDPLVHLVRNSLDHGIESPAERLAARKPPQATLRITAVPDGDAVVVEVSDDGRGIDTERVRRLAYERGVITEEEAESMADAEVADLIFRPGFSTAAQVSEVSGRGVGMDAVRSSVERLGGTVTVHSTPGAGSVVRLRLPLSMAVAQVMVFSVAGQRFGIPVEAVVETARVPREAIRRVIDRDVFVLRDEVLPVVDLAAALHLDGGAAERPNVMVVSANGRKVALIVEQFQREIDAIVRPLDGILAAAASEFAGTALLGDGTVLLVLDLKEVVRGAARAA